jgi:hypothetical protein
MLRVREEHDRSVPEQLLEIGRLLLFQRYLGLSDYFDFRLFSREEYPHPDDRESIVGWRASRAFSDALNDARWAFAAYDKIATHAMLESAGVPMPATLALYHPRRRLMRGAASLANEQEIADFLRVGGPRPMFGKPSLGAHGAQARLFLGYDSASDTVMLHPGDRVLVSDLATSIVSGAAGRGEWGYLFQERVQPSEQLERLAGQALSTFRVIVLFGPRGPHIVRAAWRVVVGNAAIDNFSQGVTDNLLAGIDVDTGRVDRVVGGLGLDLRHFERHPTTGQRLLGTTIEQWDRVRDLCLTGARVLPMLQWQHWDIAITPSGPIVIEINCEGGATVPQVATGRGLLDAEFRRFLEANGLKRDRASQ